MREMDYQRGGLDLIYMLAPLLTAPDNGKYQCLLADAKNSRQMFACFVPDSTGHGAHYALLLL